MKAKVKNSIGLLFLMGLLFSIQGVKAARPPMSAEEAGQALAEFVQQQQEEDFLSLPYYQNLREHFGLSFGVSRENLEEITPQHLNAKQCFDLLNGDYNRHYGISTLGWLSSLLRRGRPSQGLPLKATSAWIGEEINLFFAKRDDSTKEKEVVMTLDNWDDISPHSIIGPLEFLFYSLFKGASAPIGLVSSNARDSVRASYVCWLIEGNIPVMVTLLGLSACLGVLYCSGDRKARRESDEDADKKDADDSKDNSKKVEDESPDLISAALHADSDAGFSPIEKDPARTILFLFSLLMMTGLLYAYRSRGTGVPFPL